MKVNYNKFINEGFVPNTMTKFKDYGDKTGRIILEDPNLKHIMSSLYNTIIVHLADYKNLQVTIGKNGVLTFNFNQNLTTFQLNSVVSQLSYNFNTTGIKVDTIIKNNNQIVFQLI